VPQALQDGALALLYHEQVARVEERISIVRAAGTFVIFFSQAHKVGMFRHRSPYHLVEDTSPFVWLDGISE